MIKLRIVLQHETEVEWTVDCDGWETTDHGLLHTWRKYQTGPRFDEQWFVISNLSRWAVIT